MKLLGETTLLDLLMDVEKNVDLNLEPEHIERERSIFLEILSKNEYYDFALDSKMYEPDKMGAISLAYTASINRGSYHARGEG